MAEHIDQHMHWIALNGGCDAWIEWHDGGWFGLVYGPMLGWGDDEVSETERHFLATTAGAIIRDDGHGQVCVEFFDSGSELDGRWDDLVVANESREEMPR